jgi:hypothetical protein
LVFFGSGWFLEKAASLIIAGLMSLLNDMRDLEIAKEMLKERNLSLIIVKARKPIFESGSSGMHGLLQAIENLGKGLRGSSVADRVVGRAAALLLGYSRVKEVYAATLSNEGLKLLKENNVLVQYDILVPKVLDKDGKKICPFERFALTIERPDEAYEKLKTFAETLLPKEGVQ